VVWSSLTRSRWRESVCVAGGKVLFSTACVCLYDVPHYKTCLQSPQPLYVCRHTTHTDTQTNHWKQYQLSLWRLSKMCSKSRSKYCFTNYCNLCHWSVRPFLSCRYTSSLYVLVYINGTANTGYWVIKQEENNASDTCYRLKHRQASSVHQRAHCGAPRRRSLGSIVGWRPSGPAGAPFPLSGAVLGCDVSVRSSTEYIDSASRTQQVLRYLRLIRRRRRTAAARARNENRRADRGRDGTAAAAGPAAARRLIERAFSHICSSSLITLPLRGFQ